MEMYKVIGKEKEYNISSVDGGYEINGQFVDLDLQKVTKNRLFGLKENKCFNIEVLAIDKENKRYSILVNGNKYEVAIKSPLDLTIDQLGMNTVKRKSPGTLKAPMPGLIQGIQVKKGDVVKQGDALIILEAMKMENVLKADHEGTIGEVMVSVGDSVEKNQVMIQF